MKPPEEVQKAQKLIEPYRITGGKGFSLEKHDPGDTQGYSSKKRAKKILEDGVEVLRQYQEKLYAQDRWAVLLIFQAMDAAGKDGAIKHVMSGINPQGCQVHSFKSPSANELDRDYLWRNMVRAPERGRICIFNRSYYEEVLVVKVHKAFLESQKIPKKLITKSIWRERYEDINAYERYLSRNGVVIRKFFLNLSKEEQKKRFMARLDTPEKNWKFSQADVRERGYWDDYMKAYQQMIRATSTEHAPWMVVPADNKWFSRLVVASTIIDALDSLDLHFPVVDDEKREQLAEARKELEGER